MAPRDGNGDNGLGSLAGLCSGSPSTLVEGGRQFIKLPGLHLPGGRTCDALLERNHANASYPTKLYLREKLVPVTGPALNWNAEEFIDAVTWYSWSWKDVRRDQALVAIVADHLEAFA